MVLKQNLLTRRDENFFPEFLDVTRPGRPDICFWLRTSPRRDRPPRVPGINWEFPSLVRCIQKIWVFCDKQSHTLKNWPQRASVDCLWNKWQWENIYQQLTKKTQIARRKIERFLHGKKPKNLSGFVARNLHEIKITSWIEHFDVT